MKIFINPGHCPGIDSGAVGNGLKECDVALKIGTKVKNYLEKIGVETVLLQVDGLSEIANEANKSQSDLFVSIHCNSAAVDTAKGTETFHWNGSDAGQKLASKIQYQITNSIDVVNRGIKTANYAVLRLTDMPAVLVETAFINNPDDAKLLVEKEDEFARAIARGVTDYFTC